MFLQFQVSANKASHTESVKTALFCVCRLCMTNGASIAKDASDILLMDNNFNSVVDAVEVAIHPHPQHC